MKVDGSCHCGQLSYTAEIDPRRIFVCHCSDCQTFAGSAFRTGAPVKSETFHLTGKAKTYIKQAESGNDRAQVFCPECGTHIYAAANEPQPAMIMLRVSTARQRDQLTPNKQIWCRSAQPWAGPLAGMEPVERQ